MLKMKIRTSLSFAWTCLLLAALANGQDLVPVSDITGGQSIFVFRKSSKAVVRRFASKADVTRTKAQRLETARKVTSQYATLAKTAPRRTRTKSVDPDNLPPQVKTMAAADASRLFAGVGEYYIDQNEYNNSINFFRESVQLDPKNANAQSGLSEALALKGNELLVKDSLQMAKTFFEEALKLNPRNAAAYFGLGEIFAEGGKNSEARDLYEDALKTDAGLTEIYVPLGILYYQQGEIAKADDLLTKALAKSPNDAQTQYFLGLVRYSQNRNDEALTAFQKARTIDPAYAEAFYQAGETFSRLNKNLEAIEEYKKATALRNNYFEAWFGLGSAYTSLENYAEAVKAYKQATLLRNTNIEAYLNLADANRLAGNFNDATSAYNLAIVFISREKEYSKDDLADIYNKIGYSIAKQCELNVRKYLPCDWEGAIRALEKAAEMGLTNVDNANLGWAYFNAARLDIAFRRMPEARVKLDRARGYLHKAVELNPKFVDAPLLNLGVVQIDLGDFPGAVETLKKVVDKQPEWNFAKYALGTAYFKVNDFDNSAKMFRRAIDKEPTYTAAWASLGYSELKRKNGKEVEKIIAQLRRLNQNEALKLEVQYRNMKL